VSSGDEGKIRRWQVEYGREVGAPMYAGSPVFNIAASKDEKWVVSATESDRVMMWNAESHEKGTKLKGPSGDQVWALGMENRDRIM
jgi:WD40 repeat protein